MSEVFVISCLGQQPLSDIFICVCEFFQDDASSVLHSPAVRVEAAGGLAVVPGSPGHPDLLPGQRRMELPADFCQNSWQRLTVSTGMLVYVLAWIQC